MAAKSRAVSQEKELQNPVKKTSQNSSTSPSQDQKSNVSPKSTSSNRATPHQKGGRKLSINPIEFIIAHAQTCPGKRRKLSPFESIQMALDPNSILGLPN